MRRLSLQWKADPLSNTITGGQPKTQPVVRASTPVLEFSSRPASRVISGDIPPVYHAE